VSPKLIVLAHSRVFSRWQLNNLRPVLGALGCICVRGLPVCVVKQAGKMKYNRGTALCFSLALLVLALSQGALATTTYDILGCVTQVVESDGTTERNCTVISPFGKYFCSRLFSAITHLIV